MKTLLKIFAGLLVLLAVVAIHGMSLPPDHRAASSVRLKQSPEDVFAVIADIEGWVSWRAGVESASRLPDRDGHPVWQLGGDDDMPLVLTELDAPRRMVTVIPADADLAFGGSWTYQVDPSAEGCIVTVIEQGEIYNPVFRSLASLLFGYHDAMNEWLIELGAHFEEVVEPEIIPQA